MAKIEFRSSLCDGHAICDEASETPLNAVRRSLMRRKGARDCMLRYVGRKGTTSHYRATLIGRHGAVLAETTVFMEA